MFCNLKLCILFFRAESLGQVFLIVTSCLRLKLAEAPPSEWHKMILCYDNMCQLDRLLASKQLLPFLPPLDSLWSKVTKIIDGLHIANHKNPGCRAKYGPQKFQEILGDQFQQNTMAAEITFSWLTKFKKQANSMPKENQIFFIHRLVKLRNRYLERCMCKGKAPVGPGPRGFTER